MNVMEVEEENRTILAAWTQNLKFPKEGRHLQRETWTDLVLLKQSHPMDQEHLSSLTEECLSQMSE